MSVDPKDHLEPLNSSTEDGEQGLNSSSKHDENVSINREAVAGTFDPGDNVSEPADGNKDSSEDWEDLSDSDDDNEDDDYDDEWNDISEEMRVYAKHWAVHLGGRKCLRCGERHEDDSVEFWDCYYDFNDRVGYDDDWNCRYIPFTKYLKEYRPEIKVNSVASFLELGELCENLIVFTQTMERDGRSYFLEPGDGEEGHFEFELLENFRVKLKTVQEGCVKMAKKAVTKWINSTGDNWPKLPDLVLDLVFRKVFMGGDDWKEAGRIGKFEEHEEHDKALLNKTYAELAPIYAGFRSFEHGAYCDRHNNRGMDEPYLDEVESFNETWVKFQLDEFWSKVKN